MGWVWVLVVLAVMVGAGMLIEHRRYRGVPVPPGVSGRAKRRAIRQGRAVMARSQTPARDTGYDGYRPDPGGNDVS